MSRTLGWALIAWQHCLSGSGNNSPPPWPRSCGPFPRGPAAFLTPSSSPDVGCTTQREEVDLVWTQKSLRNTGLKAQMGSPLPPSPGGWYQTPRFLSNELDGFREPALGPHPGRPGGHGWGGCSGSWLYPARGWGLPLHMRGPLCICQTGSLGRPEAREEGRRPSLVHPHSNWTFLTWVQAGRGATQDQAFYCVGRARPHPDTRCLPQSTSRHVDRSRFLPTFFSPWWQMGHVFGRMRMSSEWQDKPGEECV